MDDDNASIVVDMKKLTVYFLDGDDISSPPELTDIARKLPEIFDKFLSTRNIEGLSVLFSMFEAALEFDVSKDDRFHPMNYIPNIIKCMKFDDLLSIVESLLLTLFSLSECKEIIFEEFQKAILSSNDVQFVQSIKSYIEKIENNTPFSQNAVYNSIGINSWTVPFLPSSLMESWLLSSNLDEVIIFLFLLSFTLYAYFL
jgi:hypothetical protein